jgi:ABC-type transporter Mla subunit MlaD
MPTSSQQTTQYAVKVGFLTLLGLAILVGSLVWLRGRLLDQGQTHSVLFGDVDGLQEGASVNYMGIRVGFVDKVATQVDNDQYAVGVTFSLNDKELPLPAGSTLSIQQAGLVGEKFLEITPPRLLPTSLLIRDPKLVEEALASLPFTVKAQYQEGMLSIGRVEKLEPELNLLASGKPATGSANRYRLLYRITRPGAIPPPQPTFRLMFDAQGKNPFLFMASKDPTYIPPKTPAKDTFFTVLPPLRFKDFLAIQIASAEALKETNDRLNTLLDDDTIAHVQATLVNLEGLSKQTETVLASADALFKTMQRDLTIVVDSTETLTKNLNQLSANINTLIDDPKLRGELTQTVANINQASQQLTTLLADPNLQATLSNANLLSADLAVASKGLKQVLASQGNQQQLETSLKLLTQNLETLSKVLGQVEAATNDDEDTLKELIEDTRDTAGNLKQFSEKLNGRFLLWRLLF